MFLLFISAICLFNFINAKALGYSLLGKVIYLDAGHGGVDVGACYKDIHEEDINLAITLKLKDKLESMGAKVSGSVSKNTFALICNDKDSNTGKSKKAKDIGVNVWNEDDLLEYIGK